MRARSFFSASFIAFLDLTDMAVLLHVDEVDDDEPGHVAQAQLSRNLGRCFQVGREAVCSILCSRVDRPELMSIGHQGLGRVDDQVTARFQLDDRLVHRAELVLDAIALEDRGRVA
jgi:hypothetical protein